MGNVLSAGLGQVHTSHLLVTPLSLSSMVQTFTQDGVRLLS